MQHNHLALHLPEIINHIFSFLIPSSQEGIKTKHFIHLFPCLYVNHTWHKYASDIIWRNVHFDEKRRDFDRFLKFAAVFPENDIPILRPSLSSTSAFAALSIADTLYSPSRSTSSSTASSYNIDTPECTLERDIKRLDSDALRLKLELSSRANRRYVYGSSLRSLTLRKIKLDSLNDPVARIGEYATQLVHLDIYICDYVDQKTLTPFLKHGSLSHLSLAGCNLISDSFVLQVAKHCPRLEHLDLRACGQVSDISISAIAECCPRLRHLNVGRIRDRNKITIQSIGMIAKYTNVSVLGLAGCEVDDTCMELLAEHRGPCLERVSVNSCSRISNRTIHAFIRYCPELSVFEMKECFLVDDWATVAELVKRKVLLTLCSVQNGAFAKWAYSKGVLLDVRAPQK